MIRLSRLTDYAIVVLAELVRARGQVRTVPVLTEATGLPGPTVAKVLKALATSGVVASHRGAGGGYGLERAAEQVSVVEVIVAIEGPIALTACLNASEQSCSVESQCPVRGNWDRVNRAILDALAEISLADMLTPAEAQQAGCACQERTAGGMTQAKEGAHG